MVVSATAIRVGWSSNEQIRVLSCSVNKNKDMLSYTSSSDKQYRSCCYLQTKEAKIERKKEGRRKRKEHEQEDQDTKYRLILRKIF